jgi:hypothetical protein
MDEKPKKEFYQHWWFWPLAIVLLILIGGIFSQGSGGNQNMGITTSDNSSATTTPLGICDTSLQTLKQQSEKVDYKQLAKDPDSFTGKVATFTGQILQIEQSGNEGVMRLSVTNEGYGIWSPNDVLYVTYHQSTPAVQDDIITVTGKLTGSYTYTSEANYQITIPSMDVCSIQTKPIATAPQTPPLSTQTANPAVITQPAPTPSPAPVVPQPAASWHTVATFSDQTQKNTSPFTIQGSQWRITWQETGDGYFGANAQSPDGSNYCSIANLVGTGSDSTYCYTAGTYYISVNTANNWSMTVEDYY